VTKQPLVGYGVACMCQVAFGDGFIGLGYFQGYTPGGVWYEDPEYYHDGNGIYGSYFVRMGAAPIGTDHRCTIQHDQATDTWKLYIDGVLKNTRYDQPDDDGVPKAMSEAHNTNAYLTYHHWGVQYKDQGGWQGFSNPEVKEDSPFVVLEISDTEFWTWNPEAG